MAKKQIPQQPDYRGKGALMPKVDIRPATDKDPAVKQLEGLFTRLDGASVRIELTGNKVINWHGKVKNSPTDERVRGIPGHEPWEFLGAFELKSFNGKNTGQRVLVPGVGVAMIFPAMTKAKIGVNGEVLMPPIPCLKVQQLVETESKAADLY